MNKVKQTIHQNKLLFLVLLAYIGLSIFMPAKALQSLQNSLYYVKEMLMIMPVILLLTSLISAWVPREAIERNFGQNSGFKGSIFSFLLGSFSAGPIYAAFPVCKALLSKGASISNIVIILSAWAVIKVPMLLNEAKFLGPKFMALRWVLTTLAIFVMGYLTSRLVKKEDLPEKDVGNETKENPLHIVSEYCLGCGVCEIIAPNYFKVVNKKANLLRRDVDEEELTLIKEAVKKCPSKVIEYTEVKVTTHDRG
ncbi:permease [Irregularibacter muris]|uniref:Permease n=1 Tax=Irregularibacter muris TaxID=1796619 RepID=A0AAE3HCT9_9FIRM|nr:permease [Irregularibacter muris]MCR1897371.1 permease [Irregularibacter muris]